MAADLASKVGITGSFEERALKYVGNPDLISRSHFARYLGEVGAAPSVSDVFSSIWPKASQVMCHIAGQRWQRRSKWIRGAGGLPVVAHQVIVSLSPLAFDSFSQI